MTNNDKGFFFLSFPLGRDVAWGLGNLLSFLLRCGTGPYERGTQCGMRLSYLSTIAQFWLKATSMVQALKIEFTNHSNDL